MPFRLTHDARQSPNAAADQCRPAQRFWRPIVTILLGFGVVAAASPARAQDAYPNRVIRLIVPFAAGGSADTMGRLLGEKFTAGLGQSVVVEIKAGAGGIIGSDLVAKAAPDGYTLLLGIAATHAIQPALGGKLPYDVLRDFEPVGQISTGVLAISVLASSPATSLQQFIDIARKEPGRVTYGTGGHLSGGHLVGEGLAAIAGVKMTHVSYKGGSPAFNDLLAGQIQAVITDTTTTGGFDKTGKIRVIAVAGSMRSPAFPGVPTTTEQGIAFEPGSWFALFAPARTPPAVIARLNQELLRFLAMPDVQRRMDTMGIIPAPGSPEEFRRTQARDVEIWTRIVRESGIKVEP